MESIANILITSCIPVLVIEIVTNAITCKKTKDEIMKLQESNKHEKDSTLTVLALDIGAFYR